MPVSIKVRFPDDPFEMYKLPKKYKLETPHVHHNKSLLVLSVKQDGVWREIWSGWCRYQSCESNGKGKYILILDCDDVPPLKVYKVKTPKKINKRKK